MSVGYDCLISQKAAWKAKTGDRGAIELHHKTVFKMPETQVTFDILVDFSFQFALDILIVKQDGELGNKSELSHLGL